ncbi:DNA binding domain protein, excisionase family [Gloeocapsa sp. PCC 7428]|uniref:helix-turn-helix domain-containing protein n=1 Tax=Gloeocapsa sp. PCC 7428 TaxID=1173026 RepID=UPI0002A5E20C|nr:helix-turn-helix domain-containing protein [Gloeocapsa sp. PCC 7428]AFZ30555.1 DNA binding domain protein, excisionase family [Gloeocapsa sp. PCC 7428]
MLSYNVPTDVVVHSQQLNHTPTAKLVSPKGEEILVSESTYQVLRQVIEAIKAGRAITIVSHEQELTTQQAANLLNVSRPYLIKLLEQGEIPHIKVGTHRRVRFQDLMQYKEQRDSKRREAMKQLTQFLQDEGFYDAKMND